MNKSLIIKFLLLLFVAVGLHGCQSPYDSNAYFFGIDFKKKNTGIDTFKVKGKSDDSISYSYNKTYSNLDVFAYGYLSTIGKNLTLTISIKNESPIPIQTNYFLDSFALLDKSGKTYVLEKSEITTYPSENFINPNQSVKYYFDLNESGVYLNDYDHAFLLAVVLGGEKTIYLKPIPNRKFKKNTQAYVSDTVNFREKNNKNSKVLSKFPKGTKVTVVEHTDNRVKVKSQDNVKGFVHQSFLDRFNFN